ncbi:MAG: prenyltransferase [Anaerolineales bacterium]
MEKIGLFIRLTRPLFIIGVVILYALGVGIANYLGISINWVVYVFGQLWVILLQLSTQYLNEYFNATADSENQNRTPITGGSGALGTEKLPRRTALMAAYTCLAFLASLTVVMISRVTLTPTALLIMGFALLGSLTYSTPPLKLEGSGYGELMVSIIVAFTLPAYAFILQTGELHRLVAMSAFPLTVMHLAMLLAFELPDYANDIKFRKRTIMVRIGWRNGMILHNILILSAYLLLGLAAINGMPRFVWLPVLLTLPLGLFQIWQMRHIADGAKPNWKALTVVSMSLFGAMTYLMTFAYWIN